MDRQGGCTTLLYTVSCVAVAASPTRRSLLTETANSEQLLMVAAVLDHRYLTFGTFRRLNIYGWTLFHRLGPVVRPYSSHCTVCGLDYWFACYHIHRYVALSVIGHRMCNRISGLCDKSSITIDTKRYRETSLVCCLRYYYSCCALVIIRGNQLVIFPGIALYYGNTSIVSMVLLLLLHKPIAHPVTNH